MAQKTFQQINFVTGVVDGTLAYDFDHPAYFPQEEEVAVPAPKRRRAPRTREREWIREEPGTRRQAAPGVVAGHLTAAVNAATAFAAVAAVVLLVMLLLAKIELVDYSDKALALEAEITELEGRHNRLTVEYEQVFNLKDVEETAVGVLGMQEPREDQVFYLSGVSSADKAVVITREDADMFSLGVEDIISSARSFVENLKR